MIVVNAANAKQTAATYMPPLDGLTTGLAGAWDFRQLRTAWTGAVIRVKRSSDSTQADIGTVSGMLDETALTTFVGAGSGYVVKLYDQSGNGRDLVGSGTNGGYRIVNAGVVEMLNERICAIQVTDNDAYYSTASFSAYTGTTAAAAVGLDIKTAAVANALALSLTTDTGWGGDTVDQVNLLVVYDNGASIFIYRFNNQIAVSNIGANALSACTARITGTQGVITVPGGSVSGSTSGSFAVTKIQVGGATGADSKANSKLLTHIVYFADPGATQMETLRAEIDTYWTNAPPVEIYDPTADLVLVWEDNFNSYKVEDPSTVELGQVKWIPYFYGWNVRFLTGNSEDCLKVADYEYSLQTNLDADSTYNGMTKYGHYVHDITPSNTLLMRGFKTPTSMVGSGGTPLFGFPYFGAMISTERTYVQTGYGYFETRLRLPNIFQGIHFSIWLLSSDLGWPPEIDVLEVLGHRPFEWTSGVHGSPANDYTQYMTVSNPATDWHILGFERTETELIWSLDGVIFRTAPNYLTTQPMFYLMTYEIAGDWEGNPDVGAPWPAVVEVDYVRAYEPPPPAYVVPLDGLTTGLAGAWDFRQLLTSWTGAVIRVKRSSDSTQSDIGTSSGILDEAALLAFAGSGSAWVVKLYDQSGNGRDLVGAGANGGYRIVNAGVVDKFNSHVCAVQVTDDDAYYTTATFTAYTGTTLAAAVGFHIKTPASAAVLPLNVTDATGWGGDNAGQANVIAVYGNGSSVYAFRNSVQLATTSFGANAFNSCTARFTGTNVVLHVPGGSTSAASSAAFNFTKIQVGAAAGGSISKAGSKLLTHVIYFSDPGATQMDAIRQEINDFWT